MADEEAEQVRRILKDAVAEYQAAKVASPCAECNEPILEGQARATLSDCKPRRKGCARARVADFDATERMRR